MIDREHGLPLTKQAEVLNISRGSVYYLPRPVPERDLALRRRMDELHMDYPFAGARMLSLLLRQEGLAAGRKHVATLMKKMGIAALYPKPSTSRPEPGHKIYPYLLRQVKVERPNQAWAMDITYIPMARGFVYLAAVIDWFTRRVLAWRVSITMETSFCVEALEELWKNTRPRTSSILTRAASSRVRPSSACYLIAASPSRWMGGVPGVTMSLSSGFGAQSNTRKSISGPMHLLLRPEPASPATSSSTIQGDPIKALTEEPQIRLTSPRCSSRLRLNNGRNFTYKTGKSVQTNGASSISKAISQSSS